MHVMLLLSQLCTAKMKKTSSRNPHPPSPHLASSNPLRLRIPRIHIIQIRIHRLQLRTPQPRQVTRNALHQRLQRRGHILIQTRHQRRRFRLHELEDEALEIVTLGQCGTVEDAVC